MKLFCNRVRQRSSGAALVLVLCCLVLLLALSLGFFLSATGESRNTAAFAEGNRARSLAESTVGYVIGQLRDATCQDRTDLSWVSQPGLVRTFNSTGTPDTAYKLYSSATPRVTGNFDPASDIPPTDWKTRTAEYVDLNSPVIRKSGATATVYYPILNPAAEGAVDGFAVDAAWKTDTNGDGTSDIPMPVQWMYILQDGAIGPASNETDTNRIVGRVAFWADDDTCKLNINTASAGSFWDVPRATTAMESRLGITIPVQGEFQRLPGHPASTSLGPVFSGTSNPLLPNPLAVQLDDPNFKTAYVYGGNTPGATAYYKRYSDYFSLTPRINGSTTDPTDQSSWAGARRTSAINYADANTWNATKSAWPNDGLGSQNSTTPAPGKPLTIDTDRLYNDVDELLFKPDRTSNNTAITPAALAARTFFITAQSRAPETTLFNTPRISLWPINAQSTDRTVKDRLLAFCGTIGTKSYYFDREIGTGGYLTSTDNGAESPTADVTRARNTQLLAYLRSLTSANVPGYGGKFSDKWGSGVDKVLVQVFDMLRANVNADYIKMGSVQYNYSAFPNNPRAIAVNALGALTNAKEQVQARGYVVPTKLGSAAGAGRYTTIAGVSIVVMPSEVVNTYSTNQTLTGSGNVTWTGTETCVADHPPVFNPPLPLGKDLDVTATPTSQKTNKVRAYLLFQPYTATPGAPGFAPGGRLAVTGLQNLTVGGSAIGPANAVTRFGAAGGGNQYALPNFQMTSPAYYFGYPDAAVNASGQNIYIKWPGSTGSLDSVSPISPYAKTLDMYYPFVSDDIDVSASPTFDFSGGALSVEVQTWKTGDHIQTLNFNFPPATSVPVPQHLVSPGISMTTVTQPPTGTPKWKGNELAQGRLTTPPTTGSPSNLYWIQGSLNLKAPDSQNFGNYLSLWRRMRLDGNSNYLSSNLARTGDVVFSLEPSADLPTGGDLRIIALSDPVDATSFAPAPGYSSTLVGGATRTPLFLRNDALNISAFTASNEQSGWNFSGAPFPSMSLSDVTRNATLINGVTYDEYAAPISAPGLKQANLGASGATATGTPGDWFSPSGAASDGAALPRPEAGLPSGLLGGFWDLGTAAFIFSVAQDNTFEPNRNIPSAGLLGGLLSPGLDGKLQPWRTLLFTAWPAAGRAFDSDGSGSPTGSHPGSTASPRDHLFLDNFWMPVVEPYALSEPLSTAGKVNLNFQIAPFTYITRSTALRGALAPVMVSAVSNSLVTSHLANYKFGKKSEPIASPIRYSVAMDETIAEFSKRFLNGGVFRSATAVSEVPLVAKDASGTVQSDLSSFWSSRSATADNLREQPYTALLSRVTTQSNTYTVHIRVEAIKRATSSPIGTFVPGRDQITGEWRGSYQIERYIDPKDPQFASVDFASGSLKSLGPYYRFRILGTTTFAP
jgi:uncharacterized protein (TIGR02600 family)